MKDLYLMDMLFAEKILQFLSSNGCLLFGEEILWQPIFEILEFENNIDTPKFHETVGLSVYHIIDENEEDIRDCFSELKDDMQELGIVDIDDGYFTKCALKIAPLFFNKGYSHESFLGYCAMVIGVAYNFLFLSPNRIPHRACQVIGLVLFIHQMTGEFYEEGGWKGFHEVSLNFNDCIESLWKKPKGRH